MKYWNIFGCPEKGGNKKDSSEVLKNNKVVLEGDRLHTGKGKVEGREKELKSRRL